MTQQCIICQMTPEVDDKSGIVYGALTFIGYGRYGSDYDPVSGRRHLEVTICDGCIASHADQGLVYEVQVTPVPDKRVVEFYDPDSQDLLLLIFLRGSDEILKLRPGCFPVTGHSHHCGCGGGRIKCSAHTFE
jgi:hypothetical protein